MFLYMKDMKTPTYFKQFKTLFANKWGYIVDLMQELRDRDVLVLGEMWRGGHEWICPQMPQFNWFNSITEIIKHEKQRVSTPPIWMLDTVFTL